MTTTVGYVPGVWDLFHIGHLNILRRARQHCDVLIAGVVSDEMALRAKGRRPVVPLQERLEIVQHIVYVDRAVEEDVPEKLVMWGRLHFDVIVKGDDWKGTAKGDKLERDFAGVGVGVAYLPYTMKTSSTKLRRALDMLEQPAAQEVPAPRLAADPGHDLAGRAGGAGA